MKREDYLNDFHGYYDSRKSKRVYTILAVSAVFIAFLIGIYAFRNKGRIDSSDIFGIAAVSVMFLLSFGLVIYGIVKYIIQPIICREKVQATIVGFETEKDGEDLKNYFPIFEYCHESRTYRTTADFYRYAEPIKGDVEGIFINPKNPDKIYDKLWGASWALIGYILFGVPMSCLFAMLLCELIFK